MFSRPIKEALGARGIEYSDPDVVDRILAEPANRRMLAVFRLLVNRTDSLAWATLLHLTAGIGEGFSLYIYERARAARIQFGSALLAAYEENFPGGPRPSAQRAKVLVGAVIAWLDEY